MGELTVTGLTAGYGDITAVWDLDLTVSAGQIVALLGRNGAGKTTTLHAIAGLLPASRGTVTLGDTDITRFAPYRRVSAGIALVQEGKQIFRHLTVEENLYLGAYARRIRRRHMHRHLDEQYERFPMLAERRKAKAGSLSGGQQQMLAISQALLAEPSVLMLDEPSAGLAPAIVIEVFDVVSRLRDQGIGVLLVEQLADRALAIADDVIVLDIGRVILRHDTAEGRNPAVLEAAYFGRQ
jgi:branched-chain amino acid transport system ATP-binding protein